MHQPDHTEKKLFAVYLGGRAPRCNTELHDVIFVAGSSIEKCYDQMLDKWFGLPTRVHVDSWIELEYVDGHAISLQPGAPKPDKKLYFINLGAYIPGQFMEIHANAFVVAENPAEVKKRAKSELLQDAHSVHTDDLYDIDDCLEISEIDGLSVVLEPTAKTSNARPCSAYHIIPPEVVKAYTQRAKK